MALLLGLVLLGFAQVPAQAQENTTPAALSKAETSWLQQTLDLGREQMQKVSDLTMEYAQQFLAIRQTKSDKTDQALWRDKVAEAKAAELRNVLTDQQWVMYQKKRSEWLALRADLLSLDEG